MKKSEKGSAIAAVGVLVMLFAASGIVSDDLITALIWLMVFFCGAAVSIVGIFIQDTAKEEEDRKYKRRKPPDLDTYSREIRYCDYDDHGKFVS